MKRLIVVLTFVVLMVALLGLLGTWTGVLPRQAAEPRPGLEVALGIDFGDGSLAVNGRVSVAGRIHILLRADNESDGQKLRAAVHLGEAPSN